MSNYQNNRADDLRMMIKEALDDFAVKCKLKHDNVDLELTHSRSLVATVKEGHEKLENKIEDIKKGQQKTTLSVLLQLIAFVGAVIIFALKT